MLNDLLKSLAEENEKQTVGLKRLYDELNKQEEIGNDLNEKKIELQGESAVLKARFNCIKKEVELKKNYLTEIMNKTESKQEIDRNQITLGLLDKIEEISAQINETLGGVLLDGLTKKCFRF
jgi:hypothetical protein